MARQREYASYTPDCYSSGDEWYFKTDVDLLVKPGDDFYDSVSPSENIWKKFDLITPPLSPSREEDDECFLAGCDPSLTKSMLQEEEWLTTICLGETKQAGLRSKLIQDCMWSGTDEEQARSNRNRTVSLSELTMITASTSCVDPTTFSAYPRQQNQLEHSYSLTTPEPMRVPSINTPATTDDSESEEDVIDVVTVDTRTQPQTPTPSTTPMPKTKTALTHNRIHHNLQAVANKLHHDSYKRPKCMSDHDFALPSKKSKKYHSHNSSMMSSQNSSDSEDFEGKRSAHNVMERQRRNDLKKSLHYLRDCLPTLETQERAPKVVILAHATDYVKDLQKQDNRLLNEFRDLKSKNRSLKDRLEYLQSRVSLVSL